MRKVIHKTLTDAEFAEFQMDLYCEWDSVVLVRSPPFWSESGGYSWICENKSSVPG